MAVIYSSDLKLSIISTGTEAGVWGQITNTNLYLLQQAIGGYEAISIAGGAQTTALTMSNGAISNARNAVIKLTGTITGNQVVTIPTAIEKTYIVSNGTVGAFTVEFKQAGGTGITFAATDKSTKILFADGTNIVDTGTVSETGVQTLTNKTLTSPIINEIDDANGNEQVIFTSTASAINELTITNAAAGNAPSIATTGGDTNIGLTIAPKGTGDVNVDADTLRVGDSNADATITTNGTGDLTLSTNSGSNSGTIKIFDGVNGNIEVTPNGSGVVKLDGLSYPTADGSANQALVTNGSGVLSFATPAADFVYLGTVTVTGTPTTVSLDGYFSATYKHYKIMWNKVGGNNGYLSFRVNIAGSANSSGNYYGNHHYASVNSSNGLSYGTYSAGWGSTRFEIDNDNISGATVNRQTGELTLFDQQSTTYSKSWHHQSQCFNGAGAYLWAQYGAGQYTTNYAALTGVTFLYDNGTAFLNDGEFRIYGIKG